MGGVNASQEVALLRPGFGTGGFRGASEGSSGGIGGGGAVTRRRNPIALGPHKPHGERQAAEQQLIQDIVKNLEDR